MRKVIFGLFFLIFPISIWAEEINGIYYNLDNANMTAEVTYNPSVPSGYYSGNIVIPESITLDDQSYIVTSIGNNAFRECYDLVSVSIPQSVTYIDYEGFFYCTSLDSIICYATEAPSLNWGVFDGVPQSSATLYVPTASIESYQAASQWNEFGTITENTYCGYKAHGTCGDNLI